MNSFTCHTHFSHLICVVTLHTAVYRWLHTFKCKWQTSFVRKIKLKFSTHVCDKAYLCIKNELSDVKWRWLCNIFKSNVARFHQAKPAILPRAVGRSEYPGVSSNVIGIIYLLAWIGKHLWVGRCLPLRPGPPAPTALLPTTEPQSSLTQAFGLVSLGWMLLPQSRELWRLQQPSAVQDRIMVAVAESHVEYPSVSLLLMSPWFHWN